MDEIEELKNKCGRLERTIEDLTKQANEWAEKAESDGQLHLIARSNSHKRTVKAKQIELTAAEKVLDEKLQKLNLPSAK